MLDDGRARRERRTADGLDDGAQVLGSRAAAAADERESELADEPPVRRTEPRQV